MTSKSSSWPPSNGLSTPSVSRSAGTLTTSASTPIQAPADLVFSLVVDTSTYPSWCGFIPSATINSQPSDTASDSPRLNNGTKFTYHVVMDSAHPQKTTATHLRVTDVSTPENQSEYVSAETRKEDGSYTEDLGSVYRISWSGDGGFFARGLQTERFTEVIVTGEGSCEVRTWEVMGGVLARTVKWMYKATLATKFKEWCADLKAEAEKRAGS